MLASLWMHGSGGVQNLDFGLDGGTKLLALVGVCCSLSFGFESSETGATDE